MSDYVPHYALFDEEVIPWKSSNWSGPTKNTTRLPDSLADWMYGNELLQILSAFALGVAFAPWSWGIVFFFIGIVVWEILYYVSVKGTKPFWFLEVRIAIVAASVLGWLVGRELTGKDADKLDPLLGRCNKQPNDEDLKPESDE